MEYIKKITLSKKMIFALILLALCSMIDVKAVKADTKVEIAGVETQYFEEPFVAWNYAVAMGHILQDTPSISVTLDSNWNCIDQNTKDKYSGTWGNGVVDHDMGIEEQISKISFNSSTNMIGFSMNQQKIEFDASVMNMSPSVLMRYVAGLVDEPILGFTSDGTINVPKNSVITLNLNGYKIIRPDVKLPVFHVDGKLKLDGTGMVIGGRDKSLGTNVEAGTNGSLTVGKSVKIDLSEAEAEEEKKKQEESYAATFTDMESGKVFSNNSYEMYHVWNQAVLYSKKNKKPVKFTLGQDWEGFKEGITYLDGDGTSYDMRKGELGVSLRATKFDDNSSDFIPAFQDNGSIRVPEGADIIIDLNGHTINRALGNKEAGGEIFSIDGKLSIINSKSGSQTSFIKGGASTEKGGQFIVKDKGSLSIENCSIENGIATDGGCFYCNGGKIQLQNCFMEVKW